jgi:hypothetical protein
MTYTDLKSVITDAYATFTSDYVIDEMMGADRRHSQREACFVKAIYKVLMNQNGDETTDLLTKINIQDCIRLFNQKSNSSIPIEYT